MRRKPGTSGGGYNNQQRKQRFHGGSNGGDHRNSGHNHNNGRPRKNYAAAREKYLAQARDALAAGDRVLAENYFQHADHCYRMMVEEGYQVRNNYNPQQQQGDHQGEPQGNAEGGNTASDTQDGGADEPMMDNVGQLPAFLTTSFEHGQAAQPAEPVIVQSWEE